MDAVRLVFFWDRGFSAMGNFFLQRMKFMVGMFRVPGSRNHILSNIRKQEGIQTPEN